MLDNRCKRTLQLEKLLPSTPDNISSIQILWQNLGMAACQSQKCVWRVYLSETKTKRSLSGSLRAWLSRMRSAVIMLASPQSTCSKARKPRQQEHAYWRLTTQLCFTPHRMVQMCQPGCCRWPDGCRRIGTGWWLGWARSPAASARGWRTSPPCHPDQHNKDTIHQSSAVRIREGIQWHWEAAAMGEERW